MTKKSKKASANSIVWKITWRLQWDEFFKNLFGDISLAVLGIIGGCIIAELQYPDFRPVHSREFLVGASHRWYVRILSLKYLYEAEGEMITIDVGMILRLVLSIMLVIFLCQMIGWSFAWAGKPLKFRRYMKPIDELALQAERLAKQGIDEERLQSLEEAIDQITASQNNLSVGDEDLIGIETAINNLLKRLQASYREQTRFVDDASHELRTPIAVIQGYAAMLERWGIDDRETLIESVHAIREESDHMKELVDQLLFLARGDGGRQQLHMKEIDAATLLNEVTEESKMIDPDHFYEFKKSCDATVVADEAMLKQALRIFIDNASKYTAKDGRITVRLNRSVDGRTELSVQDEGIGMEAEETAKMFERFFRGEQIRGTTKGSGLGLSIAKWIIDRHKGVIKVISYKDIGTRITIVL